MDKALIYISNYKSRQLRLLPQVVANFNSWPIETRVIVNTTEEITIPGNYEQRVVTTRTGYGFSNVYRNDMISELENYDYFIYCEDDIIIPYYAFQTYLEYTNKLPAHYICGYIRYETDGESIHLPDHVNSHITKMDIGEEPYFMLSNAHQGCFTLTREQLQKCILTGQFHGYTDDEYEHRININGMGRFGYDANASSSTDVFCCGAFSKKVYPTNNFEKLMVHHSSNKFVTLQKDVNFLRALPLNMFKERLGV